MSKYKIAIFQLPVPIVVHWIWNPITNRYLRSTYVAEHEVTLAREPAPWDSWTEGEVIPLEGNWHWTRDGLLPMGAYASEEAQRASGHA
jgi:hypothetical protein